jgi:hypothetical protein
MKSNSSALLWTGIFVLGLASVGFFIAPVRAQLEARSDKGVPYLSGGVGLDERDALRARARDYNLTLSFAEKTGNYLSDVEVVIKDAQGNTALETVSEGPWFFVKLPAGSYTVIATTMGKTHQQLAKVSATRQTQLYFYW